MACFIDLGKWLGENLSTNTPCVPHFESLDTVVSMILTIFSVVVKRKSRSNKMLKGKLLSIYEPITPFQQA